MRDRWALRFNDRDAFGEFCIALREDGVPFALAGFQTVALPVPPWEKLEGQSSKLFKKFKRAGVLEEYPIASVGKRHLPSSEEARRLLRQYTTDLQQRKYVK
jgi:hypothetical protein